METRLKIKDTGLGGEKNLIIRDAKDDSIEIRTRKEDGSHDHSIYIEHGVDLKMLLITLTAHYEARMVRD